MLILPRRTDTARDARRVGRTGDVQHQVTTGWCTGHASSLVSAAVVHFPFWTLPNLYTIKFYNVHAQTHTQQSMPASPYTSAATVSHGKQATTTDIRLLISARGTQPETALCC